MSVRCRATIVVVAALVLALAATGVAAAHVTAGTDGPADPGREATVLLSFDHGCAGEPTIEVAVRLPDSVDPGTVRPVEEDGWSATVEDGIVTWSGGEPIPDHVEAVFRLALVLPPSPGETLYLPTIQRCGTDESAWIEVPGEGEDTATLAYPAPAITLADRPSPEAGPEPGVADEEAEAETALPPDPSEVGHAPAEAMVEGEATGTPTWALVVVAAVLAAGVAATLLWRVRRRG